MTYELFYDDALDFDKRIVLQPVKCVDGKWRWSVQSFEDVDSETPALTSADTPEELFNTMDKDVHSDIYQKITSKGFKPSKFTLSDDYIEFEAWFDGTMEKGWAVPCFTREQLSKFFEGTPYNIYFNEDYTVTIRWDDWNEVLESTPLPTIYGDILEGFFLNGMEFMEVK